MTPIPLKKFAQNELLFTRAQFVIVATRDASENETHRHTDTYSNGGLISVKCGSVRNRESIAQMRLLELIVSYQPHWMPWQRGGEGHGNESELVDGATTDGDQE